MAGDDDDMTQVNFRAPAGLVRRVKARAALEGMTLQKILTDALAAFDERTQR